MKISFQGEIIKTIFHNFKRTFSGQKFSQTLECAFNKNEKQIKYIMMQVQLNDGSI